ncbi:lysophospholipase [Bacillus sp. EB106-08-02-XG196]|jgi:alpha-beta hydrolase superfamily lysophospholipase|uniref:alpha/beta hydrolase n=1 Tax=Bacillus sp. EB106-08-02-XG196 TaxID=2737049 RepID=UPI0015C4906F|nr:alpha/beta hydrolase [Bacillus sp. EB106-08-02-XG196]NWQ44631.1 lysophospholipase [Bacillus sp. EB106-08-02-XG196]
MTREGTFTGVDGAELFYRMIEPSTAPKATVIIVHGHGDHSGGLHNISYNLVQEGYIVYTFDLRGHGKSSGKRGFIKSWDEYRGDLHKFRKLVSKKQPGLPLYIIGHSMGGVIALDYAIDFSSGISGIIAIAPAISYEVTRFERLGITLMGKLKPDLSINKSKNFQLMKKNSAMTAKFYSDSLRHNTITPGLGRGLIQGVSRVLDQAHLITMPFLLQYGLRDKITPPTKLGTFFKQVSSKDKQLFEYPAAKHRPFDGAGKEQFLKDMVTWLDQQVEKVQKNKVQAV